MRSVNSLEVFKDIPFTKKHFTDRITVSYDATKGFVVANEEMAKMVDSLAKELDEKQGSEKLEKQFVCLKMKLGRIV